MRKLLRGLALCHRCFLRAATHDLYNLAQSTAYSAMVALFPALIVIAAAIGQLPGSAPIRSQLSDFFDHILPAEVSPILQSYFVDAPHNARSRHVLLVACFVSVTGASSVIAKLMEGLRRAHELPSDCWSFWRRRIRAYLLVPISLLPFLITSALVVFGHLFVQWLAMNVTPSARVRVYFVALIVRWAVAVIGSIGLMAVIYHLGTPKQESWKRTLPGAVAGTAMWFLSTLAFGWYVTRFANYSQVYGSLGAGIALLFWLYLIALSLLCGAEFNALTSLQAELNPGEKAGSEPSPRAADAADSSSPASSASNSPAHIAPRG